MNSPYKYRLEKLHDRDLRSEIVIQRDGAADLKGKIQEVAEDGCIIALPGASAESVLCIFVAWEDIRGVGCEEWDIQD